MKMRMITNTDGFVLGMAPRKVETARGSGGPVAVQLVPLQGQLVVDVDVSKELASVPLSDVQRQYRVDPRRKMLVKFKPRQAPAAKAPAPPKAGGETEAAPARPRGGRRTKRK